MFVELQQQEERKNQTTSSDVYPVLIEFFNGLHISQEDRLVFILGPGRLGDRDTTLSLVESLTELCQKLGVGFIFKASWANDLVKDLHILSQVRWLFNIPVMTEIYQMDHCEMIAEVADILHIPSSLSSQRDLICAAAKTQKILSLEKDISLSPFEMCNRIAVIRQATENAEIIVTERGTSFGYTNLIVDFRSLVWLRRLGVPLCLDVTRSTSFSGLWSAQSVIPALARAGVAVGIDLLCMEIHENTEDSSDHFSLEDVEMVLRQVLALRGAFTP